MPAALALAVTRSALAAFIGDSAVVQQFERLFQLVRGTARGASTTTADVVLDATGVTWSAQLAVGRHLVELVAMVDVVGGTATDGFQVAAAVTSGGGDATVGAGSYTVTIGGAAATTVAAVARPGPFAFAGATRVVFVRGFIDVQLAGNVGFVVRREGAPTSATLKAGSGLSVTIQRDFT